MGKTGYFDPGFDQAFGDVMGGGLTIDRGIGRQNDFGYGLIAGAIDQLIDLQVIGANAIKWR